MWFSTSVDITWYTEAAIYTKTLLSSHSVVSWWSLVNDTGEVVKQNWQIVTKFNGTKNPLCKWHTFWMAPCLICFLYYHIILYWEKVISHEKFSHNLTFLKSKLSGKFQRFNIIDKSIEILKNSWISKNFN